MMTSSRLAPAGGFMIVVAFSLTSCAQPEEAADWSGTISDSAGVAIVSNPDVALWAPTNRWRLETLLTVGSNDGDPDYEFGQISGIAVSADGHIFVFDQQAQQMKVFDRDGNFLNNIGGPGSGPGEFASGAGPVLLGTRDTLFVPDPLNRRVDRFTLDGDDAGSFLLDIADGIPQRWEATRSGQLVLQLSPLPSQEMDRGDTLDQVVLLSSGGEPLDTLLQVPSGRTFSSNNGIPEFHFFAPEPVWALGEGMSRFFGINNEYRIGHYDEAGNLTRVILKQTEPRPVTDRDQEIFKGILDKAWPNYRADFNAHYPAYLQFLSGPDGTLWVQHFQALSDLTDEEAEDFNPLLNPGSATWDVFDSEGRFLGVVEMPEGFQPLRFVGNNIYGIWKDEFDVQYLQKVAISGVLGDDV